MSAWLTAFVWTLAIELPLWAAVQAGAGARFGRVLRVALLLNLATHPLLWMTSLLLKPEFAALCGLELCVVALEAQLVQRWGDPRPSAARAWGGSLCANALSWGVGVLVLRAFAAGA